MRAARYTARPPGAAILTPILLAACTSTPSAVPPPPPPDLRAPIPPGSVGAGVIDDPALLIGGLGAEGQLGDLLLVNDRARFIIQGDRIGSSYVSIGGTLLDADIVRPDGEPDVDLVEDGFVMPGFGRLLQPTSIELLSNGSDGTAVVRVTGVDVPMPYFLGALESPTLIREQGLEVVTDYRLRPDTPLLEVVTTVTATRQVNSLALGDALIGTVERAHQWTSELGLVGDEGDKAVTGFIGLENDGAVAMLAREDAMLSGSSIAGLLTDTLKMTVGFDETTSLAPGESHTWTRHWGVGPDLAALTDARTSSGQQVAGVISTADGPVAGARVHVHADGAPYTIAVTADDGSYAANAPAGATVTTLVDGRGVGRFTDLSGGVHDYAPFAHPTLQAQALASHTTPGIVRPYAQGYGTSTTDTLASPARLTISVADGQPFTVRLGPADEPHDPSLLPRPDGLAAAGWSRGGELELLAEPGTYTLVVSRGPRFELHTEELTLTAGDQSRAVELAPAFTHPGYLWADPHAHGTPSHDGLITMEDRLLVHAAAGVQLHVGSDHDRIADYRPLLTAMGLDGTLQSIVADEVSPLQRGHLNAYPLVPDVEAPNHGALPWWTSIPESTQALVDAVRDHHGDLILQANHPMDSGIGDAAGWQPGFVQRPDYWVDDLDAMEVLNEGAHELYFPVWLDLISRGQPVVPVGVSDSHAHFQGPAGVNGTWIGLDQAVGEVTDAALIAAYRQGNVHVGRGVFLDLSPAPGQTLPSPVTLTASAKSASYARVDRLHLYRDGVIVDTIEGTHASFTLEPDQDAVYVVVAEGDDPMEPLTTFTPWATSNAYRVDVGGDGWTPPLPPIVGP